MRSRAITPVALAIALLLTVAGCAPDTAMSGSDDDATTSTQDEGSTPAEADTSDLAPVLTDAPAEGGPQMSMSATGFEPAALEISAGDVVTFTSGDGSFHGLIVNQLDGVTVADSLPQYYRFDEPGTYAISDDLSDHTAVITVQ